jgi:hypothetical protein
MKVDIINEHKLEVTFDEAEAQFVRNEADAHDMTVVELFELLIGRLFISGFGS